jgi:hypothetical protein
MSISNCLMGNFGQNSDTSSYGFNLELGPYSRHSIFVQQRKGEDLEDGSRVGRKDDST